ncbi:MAG TPA: isochorismatase family cysteine hydrolase [Burkholderiales bacterium]|nr:isochorismatase family cysteine hydrolase [Burkholderiales bacterium]
MPARNPDLHGNVPDTSPIVLILIDFINDLEFDTGAALLRPAVRAAQAVAALKAKARARDVAVIYANDNFGRWRSDFRETVRHVLEDGVRGQPLAGLLKPDADDYFVLKTKHSAFYATALELLLQYLQAKRLILTGIASDMCVLLSAADAFMRDYEIYVPRDCVASASAANTRKALDYMARVFKADTRASAKLDLKKLRKA